MKNNKFEKINNLIKKVKRGIKSIPIRIKVSFVIILIIIIALISVSILIVDESKQKYEMYDGTNLKEEK